ncbi:MAG: hypothetical protein M1812_005317 [Candelaria pacifica]|nr:MAG: hypothetical protein M1812_005317 [Candelaria pacifica]
MASNQTAPTAPSAQPVLEAMIPGFSVVSTLLSQQLNIDLSAYISYLLLLIALTAGLKYAGTAILDFIQRYFVSTAEIRLDDEMYNYLMDWVSNQNFSQKTCRFVAGTKTTSNMVWTGFDDDEDDQDEADKELELTNEFEDYWTGISRRSKIKVLQYTPSDGTHLFRYKGHFLTFSRVQEEKGNVFWASHAEQIYISCLGRNPTILKELLREAQRDYLEKDGNKTIIHRGCRRGGNTDPEWVRCMSRPPRPLSTVVLDEWQKQAFINDIKEYLHPMCRRWYSNRGIPYRRGYLFHGPPGTGKTSLCFSIAGIFGLKIYVVSLNSKSLTEDGLASLFQTLPSRCIVLLEDIDTAGMTNKRSSDTELPKDDPASKVDAVVSGDKPSDPANPTTQQGISLSALLNIIDGVASSEGRILVMTTNHIEKLDKALLRPGRVDMNIAFGFANPATIRGLFTAIYTRLEGDYPLSTLTPEKQQNGSPSPLKPQSPINGHITLPPNAEKPLLSSSTITTSTTIPNPNTDLLKFSPSASADQNTHTDSEIANLAAQFSDHIPANEFTPAEIQGFLLKHKRSPEDAVNGAVDWVRITKKEREDKKIEKLENEKKEAEKDKSKEKEKEKEKDAVVVPKNENLKKDFGNGTLVNGIGEVKDSSDTEQKKKKEEGEHDGKGNENGISSLNGEIQ